jgi:hypothetical protein
MEIRIWGLVDIHYNEDETDKALKERAKWQKKGYRLQEEDVGAFTDNTDQLLSPTKIIKK